MTATSSSSLPTAATGSASARAGAAAPLPDGPTGLERPVQLVYELDVRRLPREWQPYGETAAAARLASQLRGLLSQQGLVGRVDVQLDPEPTLRLSFRDLLPAEQETLMAEIKAQREATRSPLGGLRFFREHLGQDSTRVVDGCQRRASALAIAPAAAGPLCAAWAAIPDGVRQCVVARDLWGQAKRCTEAGQEPPGALVATALPCLESHAAEAHLALHGGLVALIDLSQADPPDATTLTAALRTGLGDQGPPAAVQVTGRDGSFRLRVMVAYEADTKRDLKAFEQALGDWLAPGSGHELTFRAVHWVGPSVSSHGLGPYCEALPQLPQGLAGCLSHPKVQALCDAAKRRERPAASKGPLPAASKGPLPADPPDGPGER